MQITITHSTGDNTCKHPAETTGFIGDQADNNISISDTWDRTAKSYFDLITCETCGATATVVSKDDDAAMCFTRDPKKTGKWHLAW